MKTSSHFERRLHDWLLILAGAAFLAMLLVTLNWLLFVRTPAPSELSPAESTPSFSREKLDSVLADFERRALQYESAPVRLPSIADPGK